ncbi:codeine O-demethylase-like [Coffea eugenioides]|uniref:codeine O-demethylase-like n=1 Tax=Coffea eugenioides TaxID=49369 RepID=UPI000F61110D|nr:codeine O-demethylase-like [Coffea eugenioides]
MLSPKKESSSPCTTDSTQKQVELDIGSFDLSQSKSSIQQEPVDAPESTVEDSSEKEEYSIARNRTRRDIRPPQRYANLVAYALSVAEKTDTVGEPSTYLEAFSCNDSAKWLIAMNEEIESLHQNETWVLVKTSSDKKNSWLQVGLQEKGRDTLDRYSKELKILAIKVLEQMTKALGMKLEDMTMLFQEGMQSMRMNYYPPCPQPELVMGLCRHSDTAGLTILLQVNEVEGLRIKKAGAWVPVVVPLSNAFIVNVGDILGIVTNGINKSVEHRATVNLHNERLSIATLLAPKLDGDMGPAPSLITPENPAIFRRIHMIDYLKAYFSRELDGKSFIDTMRTQIEDF